MLSNRLIFKTSLNDKIYYLNDTLLVKFAVKRNGISTSQLNGGTNPQYESVFNQHLTQDKINYLENHDVCQFLISECDKLNINPKYSTGLITLAKMNNVSIVTKKYKSLEVTSITTAGVRSNASCAGDPASYYEENAEFQFGTINTILLINANLKEDVLANALVTSTEAKTVALSNLKIPSQYSNSYATGTGTDGICIFSNTQSDNHITNAGKHSKLGELITKSIIESIQKAIAKQVWLTKTSQSNVLVRLNRYSLNINEFYDNLNENKFEFIKQVKIDSKKQENVAVTTSVLNLIDEAELGLINPYTAKNLAFKILKNCNSNSVKKLLQYWINYFIQD